MKKKRFEQMQNQVAGTFGERQGKHIADRMKEEYDRLCSGSDGISDPMEKHKRNNIFPVAAAFYVLMEEGMERNEAADLAGRCFLALMEDVAVSIRRIMKFPGAYRMMPWLWKVMMPKLFSQESGFSFSFYPTGSDRVKFDMTACPYLQVCRELDCMELAPVFCTTDDICYGNMHPKLIWNRTQTLARDGKPCDFDIYIKKKNK